jgi:hypothetical protein
VPLSRYLAVLENVTTLSAQVETLAARQNALNVLVDAYGVFFGALMDEASGNHD